MLLLLVGIAAVYRWRVILCWCLPRQYANYSLLFFKGTRYSGNTRGLLKLIFRELLPPDSLTSYSFDSISSYRSGTLLLLSAMKLLLNTIITLAGISCSTVAFTCSPLSNNRRVVTSLNLNEKKNDDDIISRRQALINGAATVAGIVLASPNNALAFDNKISDKYSDRPRQRGSKVSFLDKYLCISCKHISILYSSPIIIL